MKVSLSVVCLKKRGSEVTSFVKTTIFKKLAWFVRPGSKPNRIFNLAHTTGALQVFFVVGQNLTGISDKRGRSLPLQKAIAQKKGMVINFYSGSSSFDNNPTFK